MCWLNSCSHLTKVKAETILAREGSRYVPTGVVMRDTETGQMVIVEMGRVVTIPREAADRILGYPLPTTDG